jgi:hypothetical protein
MKAVIGDSGLMVGESTACSASVLLRIPNPESRILALPPITNPESPITASS